MLSTDGPRPTFLVPQVLEQIGHGWPAEGLAELPNGLLRDLVWKQGTKWASTVRAWWTAVEPLVVILNFAGYECPELLLARRGRGAHEAHSLRANVLEQARGVAGEAGSQPTESLCKGDVLVGEVRCQAAEDVRLRLRAAEGEASELANGDRSIAAEVDNRGAIDVQWRLKIDKASAQHANAASGRIDVAGGYLTLQQSGADPVFLNAGEIQIEAGATVNVNGGTCSNTGTITGDGTWNAPCER